MVFVMDEKAALSSHIPYVSYSQQSCPRTVSSECTKDLGHLAQVQEYVPSTNSIPLRGFQCFLNASRSLSVKHKQLTLFQDCFQGVDDLVEAAGGTFLLCEFQDTQVCFSTMFEH